MTDLIACLSTGKGTWGEVKKIIELQDWDKIFLITNEFGKEKFSSEKDVHFILVNSLNDSAEEMTEKIKNYLGKIYNTEVALNLTSGTGKEHMAIISAIIKSGLGFRLIVVEGEEIKEV